jgi:hypothetical protein
MHRLRENRKQNGGREWRWRSSDMLGSCASQSHGTQWPSWQSRRATKSAFVGEASNQSLTDWWMNEWVNVGKLRLGLHCAWTNVWFLRRNGRSCDLSWDLRFVFLSRMRIVSRLEEFEKGRSGAWSRYSFRGREMLKHGYASWPCFSCCTQPLQRCNADPAEFDDAEDHPKHSFQHRSRSCLHTTSIFRAIIIQIIIQTVSIPFSWRRE